MAFDWRFFLEDGVSGRAYLKWVIESWGRTLSLAFSAWGVATVLGGVIGDKARVEWFRNIPVLVLRFFTSSHVAEMLRARIQAMSRGQRYAVMTVCFTTWQMHRYVIFSIAFRAIWPPLTSVLMNLLKNSSVRTLQDNALPGVDQERESIAGGSLRCSICGWCASELFRGGRHECACSVDEKSVRSLAGHLMHFSLYGHLPINLKAVG